MTMRTLATLREVLREASYDAVTVTRFVKTGGLDYQQGVAALALHPAADSPLGRLLRLFLAGHTLPEIEATAALAPVTVVAAEAAGLVQCEGDEVRAKVRLDPLREIVVASDPKVAGERAPVDYVVPPGPASETLAAVTVRRPVAAALDLCCGSGVQTMLAAAHADHAVGTDLNPRALRWAEVTAALNSVDNVEWRLGSLFEPVAGEQFDLVVANPPFVISPGHELTYRDGGLPGDDLSRAVVVGTAAALRPGGFGHVLCSWITTPAEHFTAAPTRWLAGSGCDALVLRLGTVSAAAYAVQWNWPDAPTAAEAITAATRWAEHFRTSGIAEISSGAVILRRRAGDNWVDGEEYVSAGDHAGAHIERIFAGHDAVASLADDRALRDARLALPEDVHLVERHPGERARLSVDGGFRLPGQITPPSAAPAVLAFDGQRTLADAASIAGVAEDDLRAALSSLRDLVRRGYLTVNEGAGAHGSL